MKRGLVFLALLISFLMISCDYQLPNQRLKVSEMREDAWKLERQGRQDTCINLLLKARIKALKEGKKSLADSIKEDINRIAKSDLPIGSKLEQNARMANGFYLKASRTNHLADSAILYNQRLVSSNNLFAQRRGHLGLLKIYLYLGDNDKANSELALYEMANTLIERGNKDKIAEGVFDHFNYKRNASNNRDLIGMFDLAFLLFIILILLLAGGGYMAYLIIRNKDQREQLLRLRLAHLHQLQHDYEQKGEEQKAEEKEGIENSDIYRSITQRLNAPGDAGYLSTDDWEEIEQTILRIYPDFSTNLTTLCKLSEHEYHVCLLLKMEIAPSSIAELTAHSKEAITSTRRRLYEKAFGKKGSPKDWDDVILSIS